MRSWMRGGELKREAIPDWVVLGFGDDVVGVEEE